MKPWTTADLIARANGTKAMDPANRQRGRMNKHAGRRAQTLVLSTLRLHGIEAVELETGWRVARAFDGGKTKIIRATPLGKVLADIVGVLPGGRALLIEVKAENDDRLLWSRLDKHQVDNLDRWAACFAWCGVAWVRGLDIALIHWRPSHGAWAPGHSLTWAEAQQLNAMPLLTGRKRLPPTAA